MVTKPDRNKKAHKRGKDEEPEIDCDTTYLPTLDEVRARRMSDTTTRAPRYIPRTDDDRNPVRPTHDPPPPS